MFSNLETFLNWVLIGHFHPCPWDQKVRAKSSRGESQGEALCGGHGTAAHGCSSFPSGSARQFAGMSLLCEGRWFIQQGKKGTFRGLGAPHVPQHRCLGSTCVWREGKLPILARLGTSFLQPSPKK